MLNPFVQASSFPNGASPRLGRAVDEKKIQTGSALPQALHWCVVWIVVPGTRVLHRRKFDHRDVRDVRGGSFQHLPRTGGSCHVAPAVFRHELVHDGSICRTPRHVPDVVEPDREGSHREPPRGECEEPKAGGGGESMAAWEYRPRTERTRTERTCPGGRVRRSLSPAES